MSNKDRNCIDWSEKVRALLTDWLEQYRDEQSVDVIASPDVDGVLSILLLQRWLSQKNKQIRLIAVYTTTDLVILNGYTVADCKRALWVDHDVLGNCRSIGNHLVQFAAGDVLPDQHLLSFNLNAHIGQTFQNSFGGTKSVAQDKYPFGTAHLLAHALFRDELNALTATKPHHSLFAWLAHADSAWLTAQMYQPSAIQWYRNQFQSARWLRFFIFGYLLDEKRCAIHSGLIDAIKKEIVTIRAKSSSVSSKKAKKFLERNSSLSWSGCRGHQSIDDCTGWSAEKIQEKWLPEFCRLFCLVGKAFGFDGAMPFYIERTVGTILRGRVVIPNPTEMLSQGGSFAAFLRAEKAFSMAFVGYETLRYTVDLPELTETTADKVPARLETEMRAVAGATEESVSSPSSLSLKRKRTDCEQEYDRLARKARAVAHK